VVVELADRKVTACTMMFLFLESKKVRCQRYKEFFRNFDVNYLSLHAHFTDRSIMIM
jgi:hypothetical protein